MVCCNTHCKKCGEKYIIIQVKWCKLCQINYSQNNLMNWSENEKIDNFIQEMLLKINGPSYTVIEWIPFNQLINVKKTGKVEDNVIIYSAEWKDGPLKYDYARNIYKRKNHKEVTLKCLSNSKNRIDEFLNKVFINIIIISIS
jgi:hypothetical protein